MREYNWRNSGAVTLPNYYNLEGIKRRNPFNYQTIEKARFAVGLEEADFRRAIRDLRKIDDPNEQEKIESMRVQLAAAMEELNDVDRDVMRRTLAGESQHLIAADYRVTHQRINQRFWKAARFLRENGLLKECG